MFEEEKKVANKAPVDKITVNDLNQSSKKKLILIVKNLITLLKLLIFTLSILQKL